MGLLRTVTIIEYSSPCLCGHFPFVLPVGGTITTIFQLEVERCFGVAPILTCFQPSAGPDTTPKQPAHHT